MTQNTATRITHLGNAGIPVSDQDRSLEFFVDKLGFEKRRDIPFGAGDRWVEVAPAGAETTISILPPGHGLTPGVDTRIRFLTPDAEADHAELRARGVDVDPEIMRFGGPVPPMFGFRDPDGNAFYVVESA